MAKSVLSFSDYREYLRVSYTEARTSHPALSMESYAQRLGIGHSNLKMILSGKRHLSLSLLHNLGKRLQLSKDEYLYFEALVLKERARKPQERERFVGRAQAVKKQAKLQSVPLNQRELLRDPYVVPVLVYLTDVVKQDLDQLEAETLSAIAQRFGLELLHVEKIVGLIKKMNVVEKKKHKGETHYVFNKLFHAMDQKAYIKSWIGAAGGKIDRHYADETTHFGASTLTIAPDKLPELKADLQAVLSKYLAAPSGPDDTLAQVCIQMFPLLRDSK
jgi:uncharacterized protein (TIGR02147 family)